MSEPGADDWPRLLDLFDRLVDVEPAQRAQRLDELTNNEPHLRAHLERLLALDAGVDHFVTNVAAARSQLLEPDEAPPAAIGPWRIVRTLGTGGMGRVYLAERTDGDFEQRVALKVIRGGFTSDIALTRFLTERRILARLDHPGIASLVDGGVDEHGQPWFAMQYVDGLALPDYCSSHGLGLDARLRLFTAVCDAVAYAHRQLVVHCDLKPSNVLVDAGGQPRLLDFGIAHLLGGSGPGVSAATVSYALTPEYAAPEQLAGRPVSVATDVYALGVMLHELLAGTRPAVGATAHDLKPASRCVGAGGAVRARALRGDLDLVIATALRHDSAQRYPGADALADDLHRHLDGLPLRAQRGRAAVRVRKFLRRHLVATGLAAIAVLALLAVTTLALVEAHVARGQAARAEAVRSFLIDLFQQNDPDRAGGKTLTATDLVDLGAQRADEGLVGDPDTRIELLGTVGNLYKSLGELPKAEKTLQKRLDFASGRYPDDDPRLATARLDLAYVESNMDHIDRARQLAQSTLASLPPGKSGDGETRAAALDSLGSIERRAGNYTVAARLQRERLALLRAMPSTPPRDIASARGDLAADENSTGQYADAEANGRLAIQILQADPASPPSDLIGTRAILAETMLQTGQLAKAEALYRQNLDLDKRIYGRQSIRVAEALFPLADAIRMQGRFAESIPMFKQALALYENAVGPDHSYVATALTGLAQAQTAAGDPGSATTNLQRAYAIYAAKLGPNHLFALVAEMALAHARLVAGDAAGAEHDYRDALSRFSGPLEHHIYAESARQGLGEALAAEHRFADVEPLLRQAHATLDHAFGAADFRTITAAIALAKLLSDEGRVTDARKLIEDSRKAVEAAPPNPSTAHQLDTLKAAADHLAAPTPVAR